MEAEKKSTTKLQELTWPEVEEHLQHNDVVVVPVGSTEQHGLHLPLGTDAMVAIRLAEEAAAATNTLVTPPLWFGWSPHHQAYPGTVSLRPETLTNIVVDIGRSLVAAGANKVVVVNGHREANLPPLKVAASRLRNTTGAYAAVVDPFYIGDTAGREVRTSEIGGIGHAAELETSHMLYIEPNLVNMRRAVKNMPARNEFHSTDPHSSGDSVFVPSELESFKEQTAPTGVSGDPTAATREKGERYHAAVVSRLVDVLLETRKLDITAHTRQPLF